MTNIILIVLTVFVYVLTHVLLIAMCKVASLEDIRMEEDLQMFEDSKNIESVANANDNCF